jgi:hypothetical protein
MRFVLTLPQEDFMKRIQMTVVFLLLALCPLSAQQVTGSGTINYIPAWTGSTTQGNSIMYQSNSQIGIDTTSPQNALDVNGNINSSAGYMIDEDLILNLPGGALLYNLALGANSIPSNASSGFNTAVGDYTLSALSSSSVGANTALGYFALHYNSSGSDNTATGFSALSLNSSGSNNTADGWDALFINESGSNNTAAGSFALSGNTSGNNNTATGWGALGGGSGNGNVGDGYEALTYDLVGSYNTGVGYQALYTNQNGDGNIAIGYQALYKEGAGYNIAVGYSALSNNTSGVANIAIGYEAASKVAGGNSYNIDIGSAGVSTDNGAVRIGSYASQTSFYVAGVNGVTTGENNAVPVVIDSSGQLGTVNSSRRFKTDIQDMGDASTGLMRLRPVTFRYKKPFADGSQPIQYGLIAEEVAEVYPDLVARSTDGEIESVKYQVLDSMLLNELQRQQAEIRNLQEQLNEMKAGMAHGSEKLQTQNLTSSTPGANAR